LPEWYREQVAADRRDVLRTAIRTALGVGVLVWVSLDLLGPFPRLASPPWFGFPPWMVGAWIVILTCGVADNTVYLLGHIVCVRSDALVVLKRPFDWPQRTIEASRIKACRIVRVPSALSLGLARLIDPEAPELLVFPTREGVEISVHDRSRPYLVGSRAPEELLKALQSMKTGSAVRASGSW
jgi:hypothetical protein